MSGNGAGCQVLHLIIREKCETNLAAFGPFAW
jgi:hypothetical protein